MDTALIIVIAVVVVLAVVLLARRAWSRGIEARRAKASDLRVEATQRQESARRAELEADKERERAEATASRAEKIDPDTGGSRRRGLFGRRDDDDESTEPAR
jgi:type II secretory pathway pseudopilin PulG